MMYEMRTTRNQQGCEGKGLVENECDEPLNRVYTWWCLEGTIIRANDYVQ